MKAASGIAYTVGKPMRGTKWVVRGTLGQGGMGLVLDVVKEGVIRGAMKVLHARFAQVPEFAARFLEEVRVTARLQHVNIVGVLDFDRLEDGTPFMVMERLEGRTLGAALREARQAGRSFTAANAYAVALQVAEGLYRAHSHVPSIVHRDVKPDNLYLHRAETSFEPVVKVMDFGVAARVGEDVQGGIGTPRYMAPEQAAGEPLSPQTDQYALGLVIYQMLTGRLPWEVDGLDAAALADVRRRVPPARPSKFCPWLPKNSEAALLKALSRDPGARHDTVHGLMFGLRSLQSVVDRCADDNHSTVPMVGTLAETGSVVRGDVKTLDRMTLPPEEGRSLELFEPSAEADTSAQVTQHWERPARPAAPLVQQDASVATQVASSALDAPDATAVGSEGALYTTPAGLPSLDTPMTGAAGDELSRAEGPSRSRVRVRAWALAASAAMLFGLGSAAIATSSRGSGKRAEAVDRPPAGGPSLALHESAGVPPAPAAEAIDARDGAAEVAVPAWLAAGASAQPEAGPAASAVRKSAALRSRPPLRAAPVKAPAPDDGRDELFVPEGR
jgi:serine/threonine protein kinase